MRARLPEGMQTCCKSAHCQCRLPLTCSESGTGCCGHVSAPETPQVPEASPVADHARREEQKGQQQPVEEVQIALLPVEHSQMPPAVRTWSSKPCSRLCRLSAVCKLWMCCVQGSGLTRCMARVANAVNSATKQIKGGNEGHKHLSNKHDITPAMPTLCLTLAALMMPASRARQQSA